MNRVSDQAGPDFNGGQVRPLPSAISQTRSGQREIGRRLQVNSATVLFASDLGFLSLPALWLTSYWKSILLISCLSALFLWVSEFYHTKMQVLFLDDLPTFLSRVLAAAGLVGMVWSLRHGAPSTLGLLKGSAEGVVLASFARALSMWAIRVARRRKWVVHPALIVGSGPVTGRLVAAIEQSPLYGLRLVGYLSNESVPDFERYDGMQYYGDVGHLVHAIEQSGAEVVLLSDRGFEEDRLAGLMRQAFIEDCDIFLVPRLHEVVRQSAHTETVGAIPLVRFGRNARYGLPWKCKRLFDVVVALLALTMLLPVLVVCAIAVRVDSGPGVLFHQVRVGRDGRRFELLKFRSLRPGNDVWPVPQDRITRIGRFLRRSCLDELPQLWNIVRGDMTIVGPRPERPFFVEKFSAEEPVYALRHRVPSGLTGLAQVNGLRGDTSVSERSHFDNYYIENWSFWLDMKVICRTIFEVVGGRGG